MKLYKVITDYLYYFSRWSATTFSPSLRQFVKSGYWLVLLLFGALIIYVSPRFGAEYSPDSFAVYLIGTNLISGYGYASQAVRDFYLPFSTDYFQATRSFPPMMPVLIGVVNKLTDAKITSGLIINIFVLLGILHAYYILSKKFAGGYYWLAFIPMPLLIGASDSPSSFTAELVAGRSIPLTLLMFLAVSLMVCRNDQSKSISLLLGAALAALYLTRFDTLFFCLAIMVYIAFDNKKIPWATALGFIICISPWLFRNAVDFGKPLASDNMMTALSTYAGMGQLFWSEKGLPLIWDNPTLWISQRITYGLQNAYLLVKGVSPYGGWIIVLLSLYGLIDKSLPVQTRKLILITWIWVAIHILTLSLTPYHDARYFSISFLSIQFSVLLIVIGKVNARKKSSPEDVVKCGPEYACSITRTKLALTVFSAVAIASITYCFARAPFQAGDRNAVEFECQYNQFKNLVADNELVASSEAEALAYYSHWRTIYFPHNLTEPTVEFISWLKSKGVRYGILPETSILYKHANFIIAGQACGRVLVDFGGTE